MARNAGDYDARPMRAYKEDVVEFRANVDIGAVGAPTLDDEDPGISITRTGAGTYTLTYPAFPDGSGAQVLVFAMKSATIVACAATAIDTTAGTATIVTYTATGVAGDAASGAILAIRISGKVTSGK